MKYIYILILSFSFNVFAEIREIKSMNETLSSVGSGDMVVFDIDNTLLAPNQTLGSDQWYGYVVDRYLKSGISKDQAIDHAISDWTQVQNVTHVHPVEPSTAKWVQIIQNKHAFVMALTARPVELHEATHRQFQSAGISLISNAPATFADPTVAMINGVLYVGPRHNKGLILAQYLKKINHRPKRIIFVDDKLHHVENMENVFKTSGIPNINYRYGATDDIVKGFNSHLANIEWNVFVKSHKLIGDDQVCDGLAKSVYFRQEKLIQAKKSVDSADAICQDEPYPKACYLLIKNDFIKASEDLEKAKADFKKAGC